jgi:hypothetical protein
MPGTIPVRDPLHPGSVEAYYDSSRNTRLEGMTAMHRPLYTPSTAPSVPDPGPLLLFIQQAQLTLVYASERHGQA